MNNLHSTNERTQYQNDNFPSPSQEEHKASEHSPKKSPSPSSLCPDKRRGIRRSALKKRLRGKANLAAAAERDGMFSCNICGNVYSTLSSLRAHKSRHSGIQVRDQLAIGMDIYLIMSTSFDCLVSRDSNKSYAMCLTIDCGSSKR